MRLRALRVRRIRGQVAGLAGAAAGQTLREGLLLQVLDDEGVCGQGEASPLPDYSPDSIDECAAQLEAIDPLALAPPATLPALDWTTQMLDGAGLRAPAARFALETALLDWLGKRRQVSVAALLGATDSAACKVPLAALVDDLASARAARARGIRAFKLKIAPATFDADLALAQALRDEFGAAIALRFDANGRLAAADAPALLQRLARLAPEFVEEPVPFDVLMHLASAPVALAADEALARPGAWPALAAVCSVVVLKPTLLGGLGACLRLAHEAAARGLAVTVTHTFDGPLALAAAAELAIALPGRALACGLDRHAALAAWPSVAIPQWHANHVASAGRPGLGVPDILSA